MNNEVIFKNNKRFFSGLWKRVLIVLAVFGPATITAMADNDAGGVATYSLAGAKLGYPILFLLPIITILLAITQEMGMRLTVIMRRGLADLIRERYGVRASVLMFGILLIANVGTLVTELSAVKTTSGMFGISPIPAVIAIVIVAFVLITRGNYKVTQSIMLVACAFFLVYIFSAVKGKTRLVPGADQPGLPARCSIYAFLSQGLSDHRDGRAGDDHYPLGAIFHQQFCF